MATLKKSRARPDAGEVLVIDRGWIGPVRTRDPEDRFVDPSDWERKREKMFDKTIADSFPASDPPSSIPNPGEDSF